MHGNQVSAWCITFTAPLCLGLGHCFGFMHMVWAAWLDGPLEAAHDCTATNSPGQQPPTNNSLPGAIVCYTQAVSDTGLALLSSTRHALCRQPTKQTRLCLACDTSCNCAVSISKAPNPLHTPFFSANAAHPTSCLRQQKDLSTQSTTWSISRAQPCTSLYTA